MQIKFLALLLLVTSIGFIGSAQAHKSEVVGSYKVEVGWDIEPPIAGMNNKITIMLTPAPAEEKAASEETEQHDEAEHADEETSHGHDEGISGLASTMDVTVTLNDE